MDSQGKIRRYCEDLYVDISKRLEEVDDESESKILLTVYHDKCNGVLSALKDIKCGKPTDSQTSTFWRDIAQLLLDVTYVEEIGLVEDEFPEETAESRMKYILDSLTGLETSVGSIYPGEDVKQILGPEVMECLRWRKGALMYMFCHTVQNRHSASKFPQEYVHYLEDGIDHLVKMLKTRSDPKWLEPSGHTFTDAASDSQAKADTLQLIEQGILSDTHLLAMMYCGELCYWYSCACCKEDKNHSRPTRETRENQKVIAKDQCNSESPSSKTIEASCHISSSPEVSGQLVAYQHTEGVSPSNGKKGSHEASGADSRLKSNRKDKSCAGAGESDEAMNKHLRFVTIGNSCLKKYLNITNGPLVGAGWSSSRAEEILHHFDKLKL